MSQTDDKRGKPDRREARERRKETRPFDGGDRRKDERRTGKDRRNPK